LGRHLFSKPQGENIFGLVIVFLIRDKDFFVLKIKIIQTVVIVICNGFLRKCLTIVKKKGFAIFVGLNKKHFKTNRSWFVMYLSVFVLQMI
jgi:hypothetical protein